MARINRTRYVVLGLLGLGPRSGYDIRSEVRDVTGYFWNESYGQIYPVLARMTGEGLIRRKAEPTGGRVRHVYSITPRGRRILVDWLEAPVEPEVVRRELLLKLFFGRNVPAATLVGHVKAFRDRALGLGERVAAIERQLGRESGIERDLPYWLLTTRFGRQISATFVEWSDAVIAELRKRSRNPRPARRAVTRGTPKRRRPSQRSGRAS